MMRGLPALAAALLGLLPLLGFLLGGGSGCVDSGVKEGESVGQEGRVAFIAETELAFSARLLVGSRFSVATRALADDDEKAVAASVLQSSDEAVLTVDGGIVTVAGPGTAELVVTADGADGVEIDRIALHAGKPGATTLVSGPILAVTDTVDGRLPARFAVQTDASTVLLVSAVDKCGGDLLDLHASSLEATGTAPMDIDATEPASFTVKTQVPGEVTLTLKTPGLEDLAFDVKSIDPGSVDEVQVAASAADGATVTMFGRAFVDDVELVGDLSFSWAADPRVTLEGSQGLAVRANVSFPAEGEPPDDRPARVTAEVFGESGSVDLLAATVVSSLGTPARVFDVAAGSQTASCQGRGGCDPEAALLGLLGLRGLRRLRGARGGRGLHGLRLLGQPPRHG